MVKGKYGLTHIVLSNNFQQSFSKAEIVESNFYFFLKHHLKTLNKEEYNLTHVIKNTHGLAYVAIAIFLTDCAWLFKLFEFENGSRMSNENLVILEFEYLQNKKW